jgi:hypothetical protein
MKKYILTALTIIGFITFNNQLKAQGPVKSLSISFKGSQNSSPNITDKADNAITKFFKDSVTVDVKITTVTGKVFLGSAKASMLYPEMIQVIQVQSVGNFYVSDFAGCVLNVKFNFPSSPSSSKYTYLIDYTVKLNANAARNTISSTTASVKNNSINKTNYFSENILNFQ